MLRPKHCSKSSKMVGPMIDASFPLSCNRSLLPHPRHLESSGWHHSQGWTYLDPQVPPTWHETAVTLCSPWVGQPDASTARHHICVMTSSNWQITVTFVKQPNLATNGSHHTSMRRVARLVRKWVLTYVNSVANCIWSLLITSRIL